MICEHCGTEIADNALMCYRCGQASSEPLHLAALDERLKKSKSRFSRIVTLTLFLAAALATNAAVSLPVSILLVAVGGLLIWRFW